jgi:hypothetical protein
MITRILWTFKNNETAHAPSRLTASVTPAARSVVLPPRGRAAPIAAVPNCHRTVRVLGDRQDRPAATLSLRPRVHAARGNLASPQFSRRAPLFDATNDRWIVPPSTVTVDAGAAAELRHTHNAAHNERPAVVPDPQAAGRLDAVLEVVTVAMGLVVFGMIAYVLMVVA